MNHIRWKGMVGPRAVTWIQKWKHNPEKPPKPWNQQPAPMQKAYRWCRRKTLARSLQPSSDHQLLAHSELLLRLAQGGKGRGGGSGWRPTVI